VRRAKDEGERQKMSNSNGKEANEQKEMLDLWRREAPKTITLSEPLGEKYVDHAKELNVRRRREDGRKGENKIETKFGDVRLDNGRSEHRNDVRRRRTRRRRCKERVAK
jgi:hypothetical protein